MKSSRQVLSFDTLITHAMPWLTSALRDSCWLFLPRTKINTAYFLCGGMGEFTNVQALPSILFVFMGTPFSPVIVRHDLRTPQ